MVSEARARGLPAAAGFALVSANARFWPTVFPQVRSELHHWERHASAIPDPVLRMHALEKLERERFNTEVAATLATLAPAATRGAAVTAIVALEVMYDYLDGLTEQPALDPLANGRQLYRAFTDALAPAGPQADHYRHHPRRDDGGYLAALAEACRVALWSLPSAEAVAPTALAVAQRCGEAQTRTHAARWLGTTQLRAWATVQPECPTLRWWEIVAGGAASVLTAHALIAVAAEPATTAEQARGLASAYLVVCALTTLLDSVVDAVEGDVAGEHPFIDYYRDEAEATERLASLAREAVRAVTGLPRAPHHLMTVAGAVAFYLSAPVASGGRVRRLTGPMARELRPLLRPALGIFAVWRRLKAARSTLDSAMHESRPRRGGWAPCRPQLRCPPPPRSPYLRRRRALRRRLSAPYDALVPPAAHSGTNSNATASNGVPHECAR
jgi:tetraprenyl-beta-curcumene synthase